MKLLARVCFDDLEAKNFYRLREIFQALLSSSLEYPNVNVPLGWKKLNVPYGNTWNSLHESCFHLPSLQTWFQRPQKAYFNLVVLCWVCDITHSLISFFSFFDVDVFLNCSKIVIVHDKLRSSNCVMVWCTVCVYHGCW